MIFRQCLEIVTGRKTQTRRMVKATEFILNEGGVLSVRAANRLKWEVGRDYAVVQKRGEHALWWQQSAEGIHFAQLGMNGFEHVDELEAAGYRPLRIRITNIRLEKLNDLSDANARAEGYSYRREYRELWNSINKRPGTRWDDNPLVWVLEFELVTN